MKYVRPHSVEIVQGRCHLCHKSPDVELYGVAISSLDCARQSSNICKLQNKPDHLWTFWSIDKFMIFDDVVVVCLGQNVQLPL